MNMILDINKKEEEFKKFLEETKERKVKEVVDLFKELFGLNRRTYFRWKYCIKNNLPLNSGTTYYRKIIQRKSSCYFCEKNFELVVHHKDKNHKNNKKENLLILCPKCHRRLHILMILKPNTIYVVNVSKTNNDERGLEQIGKQK